MALLSTPLGLKIVGAECLVGLDFRAMTTPRPEAVFFTFSITKFYHDFAVGRRLIFQQSLRNIPTFSLRLDNAMDSSRFLRAIDLMFRHLEWLGFPVVRYILHERLLSFCVRVIAEHGGNVGPQEGVLFHSTLDLHFDVEPQVLLHDSRLFLRSPAGHYEPIDFEHHFDYEDGSDSESEDDEDPEGEAGEETEAASDGDESQKEVCSICFDEFDEETEGSDFARLPCSHMFHYECISLWFERSRTCPLCRREVD